MSLYLASSSYRRTLVLPCSLFLMSLPLSGGFVKLIFYLFYFISKMSVRNILDGTIPVGGSGGLTPESEIEVKRVNANFANISLIEGDDLLVNSVVADVGISVGDEDTRIMLIRRKGISTPSLTLGGEDVLKMTKLVSRD